MDVLRFTLSGKHAFFKKPEVNSYYYFTYGNVHKVALLGMFGAVLGYGGYNQMRQEKDREYPEFYERLSDLKIAVIPSASGGRKANGFIPKRIQSFNNSVGYASKEQGGNLIVNQQWLETPCWEIYVMLDCEEARKLSQAFLSHRCVYVPYLGSNDHPADFSDVDVVEGSLVSDPELERIHSFFIDGTAELDLEDDDTVPFKYTEYLPVSLTRETNMYELEKFIFTNLPVTAHTCQVWRIGKKHIVFY